MSETEPVSWEPSDKKALRPPTPIRGERVWKTGRPIMSARYTGDRGERELKGSRGSHGSPALGGSTQVHQVIG